MATDVQYPDQAALARLGSAVRARLTGDSTVYSAPVDRAEIFAVSEFLSAGECSHLIEMIDRVARPSETFDSTYQANYRTSYSGDVDPNDSFARMIERRLSDLLGIEPGWGETFQGQRYMPGQEFQEHTDWFYPNAPYCPGEEARGGQRSWTAMVYLNDVEEGGETEFVKLGVSIPPQRGALIIWNNALADGSPNHDTLHAAKPVVRGVKYVITKWFRTRRWR
jgi:prolyl 4-hydroxylase